MATASLVLHRGEYALHTERNITDIINENRKILWHALLYSTFTSFFFRYSTTAGFLFRFCAPDEIGAKCSCELRYKFFKRSIVPSPPLSPLPPFFFLPRSLRFLFLLFFLFSPLASEFHSFQQRREGEGRGKKIET